MKWLCRSLLLFVVAFGMRTLAGAPDAAVPTKVSFYKDVRPLVQLHCQGCHQPAKPQGGFVATEYAELFKAGNSGKEPIVKGKPDESHIVQQIAPHDGKPPTMPKDKEPLTTAQVQMIRRWIK